MTFRPRGEVQFQEKFKPTSSVSTFIKRSCEALNYPTCGMFVISVQGLGLCCVINQFCRLCVHADCCHKSHMLQYSGGSTAAYKCKDLHSLHSVTKRTIRVSRRTRVNNCEVFELETGTPHVSGMLGHESHRIIQCLVLLLGTFFSAGVCQKVGRFELVFEAFVS